MRAGTPTAVAPCGDVGDDHGVGADPRPVADGDSAQNLGAGPDEHIVPDDRTPLPAVVPTDGHALVNQEIGADALGREDGALPMGDKEPRSDVGPGQVKPDNPPPQQPAGPGQEGPRRVAALEPVVVHGAELREGVQQPPQQPGPVGNPEYLGPPGDVGVDDWLLVGQPVGEQHRKDRY